MKRWWYVGRFRKIVHFVFTDLPSLECIMSETAETPASLRLAARQKDIPIVTVEWIIQTLIHGEKQAFDEYLYEELE